MRVEVLYVAGCPSHLAAVNVVKQVLASQRVAAEIQEVLVADERMAADLNFCGSPTIRINGRDVADAPPETAAFALCCRLYPGSSHAALPSAELIHRAVLAARTGEGQ